MQEADDHVRDLDPRVVDVVLDADLAPTVPQHPHERVAERRVAHVADVGGLVRVDARVLDDDVPGDAGRARGAAQRDVQLPRERGPVEKEVDVAAAGHLRPADAGRVPQLRGQPVRDLPRLATQRPGQVEGRGEREVTHLESRRVLE